VSERSTVSGRATRLQRLLLGVTRAHGAVSGAAVEFAP
jgi:hypothetical protein